MERSSEGAGADECGCGQQYQLSKKLAVITCLIHAVCVARKLQGNFLLQCNLVHVFFMLRNKK